MIGEIARAVLEFAKDALRAEGMSPAGRVNLVGMVLGFLLLAGIGSLDLLQAVVRTFRPHYHHGVPFEELFWMFLIYLAVCAFIGGLFARS